MCCACMYTCMEWPLVISNAGILHIYGCPTVILSDQGREFVNKVTEALFKRTNPQHFRLSSSSKKHACTCIIIINYGIYIDILSHHPRKEVRTYFKGVNVFTFT